MKNFTLCLGLLYYLLLLIPLDALGQGPPPVCQPSQLNFGTVVPGETKTIHYSNQAQSLCHRQTLSNDLFPITTYFTLPTHLTNGIDTIPITFGSNNAYVVHKVQPIIMRAMVINPNTSYSYFFASEYIQFQIGGTITVPPLISPGAYTGTVTINVIHQ
jgi:hypothetical protein